MISSYSADLKTQIIGQNNIPYVFFFTEPDAEMTTERKSEDKKRTKVTKMKRQPNDDDGNENISPLAKRLRSKKGR